jgi:O-antigen/teichoic acid export membrane protein
VTPLGQKAGSLPARLLQRNVLGRLTNVGLRGMTLASKFLLVLFLAKFLEPAALGLYGLLVASVGYALYLVGLDFYTYTTREIIKRASGDWGDIVKSQVALSAILYVIFVPLLCLLFYYRILPVGLMGWFFILLVLEHFAQELNRVLVALSAQLVASVVLFLRSGIWAIVCVVVMFFDADRQSLQFVLLCWTVGGLSACAVSLVYLARLKSRGWSKAMDWHWIKSGVLIAVPFLVSTLATRGIFTLDRYWLEHLAGLEVLGAYVLFMNISNALISFLDAGVFVYLYPSLIAAHNSGHAQEFRQGMLKLTKQCVAVSVVFGVVAMLLMPYVLKVIDKAIYTEQSWMFPWVLLATALFSLGMIPQFGLYAQGKDKHIIMSHIAGFVAFVLVVYSFSEHSASAAVLAGLVIGFGLSAIWKAVAYQVLSPSEYLLYKRQK